MLLQLEEALRQGVTGPLRYQDWSTEAAGDKVSLWQLLLQGVKLKL